MTRFTMPVCFQKQSAGCVTRDLAVDADIVAAFDKLTALTSLAKNPTLQAPLYPTERTDHQVELHQYHPVPHPACTVKFPTRIP